MVCLKKEERKMPKDTPLQELKAEIGKAIGLDRAKFDAKFQSLQKKWQDLAKKDEYSETRVISPLLFNKSKRTSVNTSILSDNLSYFEAHYEKEYGDNPTKALTLACLCGSKNVADFLLRKLGKTYLSEEFDFVLGYAAASFNVEWVKEIAFAMVSNKIPMPRFVYSSVNSQEMVDEITKIFSRADEKAQALPKPHHQ